MTGVAYAPIRKDVGRAGHILDYSKCGGGEEGRYVVELTLVDRKSIADGKI